MIPSIFTPFTVQQLFPKEKTPEVDDKKVKATLITNIKCKTVFEMGQKTRVDDAVKYADSHYTRLSRKVETYEIDQMLFQMYQKGVKDGDLAQIATCYGFSFQKSGPMTTLNRL